MVRSGEARLSPSPLAMSHQADPADRALRHTEESPMRKMTFVVALAAGLASALAIPASAQDGSAQAAYRDIEQTLGLVPTFFKLFPEAGIAGAWAEFKA